jgi:hypothetical protein
MKLGHNASLYIYLHLKFPPSDLLWEFLKFIWMLLFDSFFNKLSLNLTLNLVIGLFIELGLD